MQTAAHRTLNWKRKSLKSFECVSS